MAEDKKKVETAKSVCEQCGLIHETPISHEKEKSEDIKIAALSITGICLLILIWIWVFRWGVPLVKQLSSR